MYLDYKDAHSTEMNPDTPDPVIDLMEEQKKVTAKGGTMRLGSYPCELKEGSLAEQIMMELLKSTNDIVTVGNLTIAISNPV